MPRLDPGTRLGPYEILAPLGAGGMGEVYRARDPRLGRDVALKVLPEAVAADPARLARFEREARAVAALSHPNVVVLHTIEHDGALRFLTMELVEGDTLGAALAPGGLPLARALDWAVAIAGALAAAHEKGVVHRDLKPGNVMVTRDGRVKVLDFGLAKLDAPDSDPAAPTQALTAAAPLSTAGQVLGTAPYMAPEQLRGEALDARADLFAFGVVLYEMLAGRRPFGGATTADVTSAILRDAPPPLRVARPELPPGLERLVSRCLEKDRAARPASASDVRAELDAMRRDLESGSRSSAAAAAAPSPPSLAVLPFVNRSPDPENEYFSDGLAEELINVLARNPSLRVVGRTSSFAFKGRQEDLRAIGQSLGVASLLEGSVRKSGNRARITVQLVKAADGLNVWSETYDRVLDDVFAAQDEIARCVALALDATLVGVPEAPRRHAETFDLLLQANHFLQQEREESFQRAEALFRESIARVSDEARAWAGLAKTLLLRYYRGFTGDLPGTHREARAAVERAVALDPEAPEVLETLALLTGPIEFRWPEAREAARKAAAAAPGNGVILVMAATFAGAFGEMEEALSMSARAVELDPLSASTVLHRARVLLWSHRHDDALVAFRRALELSPGITSGRALIGACLLYMGRAAEALAEARLESSEGYALWVQAAAHHSLGDDEASRAALAKLVGLGESWAYQIACVHAWRGEADSAFAWLERAYASHDSGISLLRVTGMLEPIRRDPRWEPLLRRVGLLPSD